MHFAFGILELSAVKRQPFGISLAVHWLVRGNVGSIPGLGTKIPHASRQLSPCVTTTECVCTAVKNPREATKIPTQPNQSINILKKVKTICCQRIIRKVSPPGQTAVPPSHCLLSPPLLSSLPLSGPLPPTPSSPLAMVLNNSAPRRSLLHPAPAHYWRALTNTSALIPAHYVILATFLSLPHTPAMESDSNARPRMPAPPTASAPELRCTLCAPSLPQELTCAFGRRGHTWDFPHLSCQGCGFGPYSGN